MAYYREILAEHSAIWSDLYAITMSQALFTHGKHDAITTFHGYIRKNPFGGSYLLTGGQNIIREWLEKHWQFDDRDIEVLRGKKVLDPKSGKMEPLFTENFLQMLADAKLELTVDMMPEGEIAFPDEPIVRVRGPLWQCLMVEAAILNCINSQSLFATLASRLMEATRTNNIVLFSQKQQPQNDFGTILEFGLRRAQDIGGLAPTRGAYLGGVSATSNVLAEKYYNIPTAGTFAHALVMSYEDELEAFSDYAKAMPHNGIFLVDTYDTIEGVKKAIQACKKHNVTLKGVRLDSGDLTELSKQARILLDEAGFTEAKIAASNDLDGKSIVAIIKNGGKIDIWGVGTNLVTAKLQPALGGVYKLGAVYGGGLNQGQIDGLREEALKNPNTKLPDNFIRDVLKLSEQAEKSTLPGELDVLRIVFNDNSFSHDVIVTPEIASGYIAEGVLTKDFVSFPKQGGKRYLNGAGSRAYKVLVPFFKNGDFVGTPETIHEARERAFLQKSKLGAEYQRLEDPVPYTVEIEESILARRNAIAQKKRMKKAL